MNLNLDKDSRVCLVCGRVLNYWEGKGWAHTLVSTDPAEHDHPAIPVLPEEAGDQVRGRCDFCFADEVVYILPSREFVVGIHGFRPDWAACESCGQEISKNAWNSLLRRVWASEVARHGELPPEVQAHFKALYRTLRKNISGPLRPV